MLKAIVNEIQIWWYFICLNSPGRIGFKLRKRLIKSYEKISDDVIFANGLELNGLENISIGPSCSFGSDVIFQAEAGTISIGNNVRFNRGVTLGADFGTISIGNDVIVAMNVVMRCSNHNTSQMPAVKIINQGHSSGKILIGNDVWIGANVVILPNVEIGDHCVIGAGSIVTKNIPSRSIAVGNPAKIIKSI